MSVLKKAAILAIGSELLGTRRVDTNSLKITAALERHGVELIGKSIAPDNEQVIAQHLKRWAGDADLILVSGGLGPTADDVTRPAVALAFDRSLSIDEEYVEIMRQRFNSFGRVMPEVNRQQAQVIEGAEVIPNPLGTAPAQRLEHESTTIFLFPAVPTELVGLIESSLEPWLRQTLGNVAGDAVEHAFFKLASRGESDVEQRLAPFYERFGRQGVSVLASPGEVLIQLTAFGPEDQRRARLGEMSTCLREIWGHRVFTEDVDDTLEVVVGRLLTEQGATLTTAESCTGGLLAERLTRVAGSSAYFLGGVVTYTNELKTRLLGVDPNIIASQGAVSEGVARAMAEGVRQRYGSDYGTGITGVAGPGGGSDEKPVGTVDMAIAGPAGTEYRRVRFMGNRERVRLQTSQLVLELLRRQLLSTTSS